MRTTTMTARQFNHDVSGAKRAAADGPVVITDRGRPSHVLLTVGAWESLTHAEPRLSRALRMPDGHEEIDFEPGRVALTEREVDL